MRKLIYIALLAAVTSHAQDDHRVHVMPSDREQPSYVLGENQQRWLSSRYYWYYNPQNQPAGLSTDAVVGVIQRAAARWSGMCNVTITYLGITPSRPYMGNDASAVDTMNIIGWDALTGDLADAAAVTHSWVSGDALLDADIAFNTITNTPWTITYLDGVITHELGHAIGVKHSNVQASVMFANPYHEADYMRALRGDDSRACAALYGAASTATSDRSFNWAEAAYSEYLSPRFSESGYYMGYYYRYYPATRSYLGSKDGVVYYMGPDALMYSMGNLNDYSSWVTGSGY